LIRYAMRALEAWSVVARRNMRQIYFRHYAATLSPLRRCATARRRAAPAAAQRKTHVIDWLIISRRFQIFSP
jgi:hypothetical protein